MSLIALDVNQTRDYSLLRDTGADKVVFKIGVIPALLRAKIDDKYTVRDGEKLTDERVHQKMCDFARFGLKGWNLKDAQGTDVAFQTVEADWDGIGKAVGLKDECLNRLDLLDVIELGVMVVSSNRLSGDTEKSF